MTHRSSYRLGPLLVVPFLFLVACGCSNSSGSTPGKAETTVRLPPEAETPDQARERTVATLVARLLENEHLREHKLDDQVSEKAFKLYLAQLDPAKLFLLDEHVHTLRKHSRQMDDQMRDGRLELARESAELFARRLAVVEDMTEKILATPFDFSRDEALETDPDKRSFARTEDELRERWRKVLKYDVMLRIARMEDVAEAREKRAAEAKKAGPKPGHKSGQKSGHKDDRAAGEQGDQEGGQTAPDASGADGAEDDDAAPGREIPKTAAGREKQAREDVARTYAGHLTRQAQLEPIDYTDLFLNAVVQVYDPHTAYLPPARKENFDIRMSGSLEGIGALLQEDDQYIRVSQIVPGSASWRQGELEAGDLIVAVAEGDDEPVDVAYMRLNKVVKLIRGKKGTVVSLTVEKPDGRTTVIPITRDVVKIEAAYAQGAYIEHPRLGQKVGYIELPSFYGNSRAVQGNTPDRRCTDDVRRLLDIMAEHGVESVILDLRGNGGGFLQDAQEMSGLFIETGPIVQTRDASGDTDVLHDRDPGVSFRGHVVVLVDRFSASASEILAGALQDYGRAIVVGTSSTHGKGTVQVLVSLDQLLDRAPAQQSLGVIKLTRQQFFRITGSSTQQRGVSPDISLPDPTAHVESGERHLDYSIPWSEIDPLEFERWDQPPDVARVRAHSLERQAKNPVLQRVVQRIALWQSRRDQTVEPLDMAKWREKRKAAQAEIEALDLDLDEAPARFKVTEVDYDGSRRTRPARKAPGKENRKTGNAREDQWRESLARDPWLEETLLILADMAATP